MKINAVLFNNVAPEYLDGAAFGKLRIARTYSGAPRKNRDTSSLRVRDGPISEIGYEPLIACRILAGRR